MYIMSNIKYRKFLLADLPIVTTFLIVAIKALVTNIFLSTKITMSSIFTTAGLLLILISLCVFLPPRPRKYFLFSANVAISFLLFADSLYFSYFGVPFSMYALLQTSNLSGLGGSILHLIEWKHAIFIFDLPFLLFLFFYSGHESKSHGKKVFILLFAAGCVLVAIKPVKRVVFQDDLTVFKMQNSLSLVYYYGALGNRIVDTMFFFTERTTRLDTRDLTQIEAWFSSRHRDTPSLSRYRSLGKGKNIILIQVESLQNFVLTKTVEGQEITPHLNRLLEHSVYFENIYPQTVEGNSSDAELIANTSLFPLRRGSTFCRYPGVKYNSLGSMLKRRGYHTVALHGDTGAYWNRRETFPNMGFDRLVELRDLEQDDLIGMGLSDLSMFRQSIPLLKKIERPFYAFYITLSSHMPFKIPAKEQKLNFSKTLSLSYLGDYLQSINYADRALGFFLGALDDAGLLRNTLVVIYGDHAGMMEKDRSEIERFWSSESISDDEWVRAYATIPLIIHNPSISPQRMTEIGGQIDILPTIAHLMGFDAQEKYMLGANLFGNRAGWALLPRGDYKRKEVIITKNEKRGLLNDSHKQMLDISELMIKGDFFRSAPAENKRGSGMNAELFPANSL